ncbi:MAG: hypothetical protein IPK64_18470 [bacterium]|nr:hypothetical protein [bacterium]
MHGYARRHIQLLAVIMATAAPASAGEDWRLTARGDSDLKAVVAELTGGAQREAGVAAICLLHERIFECEKGRYRITENIVFRVYDVEGSDVATRHFWFPPRSRIDGAGTWVLRGDEVLRGGKGDANVVQGDGSAPTEVILTAAGVRDGDVIGFTVRRAKDRTYPGLTMLLAGEHPVKLQRVRVLTDGAVAYYILGRNLVPGSYHHEVLEQKRGTASHTVAEIRDIDVAPTGPYAPPPLASAPLVSISWRGELDPMIGRWRFLGSWSEAAVWIQAVLDELAAGDKELERTAASLVAGKADAGQSLRALHDFVRGELVAVENWQTGTEYRTAGEVLAARNATAFEAGTLLYALALAADLPVRPVFTRSTDWGPINDGNPGLEQFSDLLVEDLSAPGTYYAPGRQDCAGGLLPDDLLGATAMVLAPDLAERERALIEDVFSTANKDVGRLVADYQQRAAREPWQTTFKLPGRIDHVRRYVQETMTGTAGSDTFAIQLLVQETAGCRDDDATEPQAAVRRHVEASYADAVVVAGAAAGANGTLTGRVVLPVGAPSGEVWPLATTSVFGEEFISEWEGVGAGAFYLASSEKETRTWRLKLPPGWRLATAHPDFVESHPRFRARARALVVGDELVVWREREYRRGVTAGADLEGLEAAIRRVRGYEAAPIILERTGSGGQGS